MSLQTYDDRRSLPYESMFSDVRGREEEKRRQEEERTKARKTIGRLGMFVFLLVGAVIVVGALAAGAAYLYAQKSEEIRVLRDDNTRLASESGDYGRLREARGQIQASRRDLLNILERPNLTPAQRTAAQQAARVEGFRWTIGADRATNEASQNWPGLYQQMGEGMDREISMLTSATEKVNTAIVTQRPPAPTPGCPDPRLEDCGIRRQ